MIIARVLAGCCAALFTISAANAYEVLHPEGSYTQPPSGMVFPTDVNDFHRVSIVRYRRDETDESAGYNRTAAMSEIVATVYVFRSPNLWSFGSPQDVIDSARAHLCAQQFQGIKQEIASAHPDAKLLSEGHATLNQGGKTYAGHKATYSLTNANFLGRSQVLLRSEAYVFCFAGGKWTVEYRIDYPAEYDASSEIASFMRDLTWTISQSR